MATIGQTVATKIFRWTRISQMNRKQSHLTIPARRASEWIVVLCSCRRSDPLACASSLYVGALLNKTTKESERDCNYFTLPPGESSLRRGEGAAQKRLETGSSHSERLPPRSITRDPPGGRVKKCAPIPLWFYLVFFCAISQGISQELATPRTVAPPKLESDPKLVSILKQNLPQKDQTMRIGDAPEWFQTMMQRIVRENIPQKYVRDKDWGLTAKRWDGLQVKRKGPLRITTKRKWKEVNHGAWKRYEVSQIDPDENLLLRIENVKDAEGAKVAFEVELASKLHVHGRRAQWAKGVQMYNVSADADASVVMRLWCEVGMRLDVGKFPPDVILVPKVTKANLDVTDFRLQSISKLDGPLVKKLSGSVHNFLLEKIAEKRHELPKKINKEIAKNDDKMRLSMSDFALSKWNSMTAGKKESDSKAESKSNLAAKSPHESTTSKTKTRVTSSVSKATRQSQLNPTPKPTPPSAKSIQSTAKDDYNPDNVRLIDLSGTNEWTNGQPRSKPIGPELNGPNPGNL